MTVPAYLPVAEPGSPCPDCATPLTVMIVLDTGRCLEVLEECPAHHFTRACAHASVFTVLERVAS